MLQMLCAALIGATILLGQRPDGKQVPVGAKTETTVPEWRRSALKLNEQIKLLSNSTKGEALPEVTAEFFTYGGTTSSSSEVMRRFSGDVVFDGAFQGLKPWGLPEDRPRQKVELLKGVLGWLIFSKTEEVEAWRAVPLNSKVRFRARVEGIGRFPLGNVEIIVVSLKDAVPLLTTPK